MIFVLLLKHLSARVLDFSSVSCEITHHPLNRLSAQRAGQSLLVRIGGLQNTGAEQSVQDRLDSVRIVEGQTGVEQTRKAKENHFRVEMLEKEEKIH